MCIRDRAYVLLNSDLGILHIIVGSSMTAGGFMLARKMVKVRNVILGKISTTQKWYEFLNSTSFRIILWEQVIQNIENIC